MAEFKAKQNPQTEKEMLDAIAEASFIAPIALQKQLDEVEPDENGQRQMQASLMAVSNKDGSKFFPAFTDWLEFLKWKNDPEADTMVITFDQYCGILLKQGVDINGIVINPSETNIVIRKEKMAEMKGVSVPADAPKNHRIMPLFGTEKITNSEVIIAADRLRRENNEDAKNNLFNDRIFLESDAHPHSCYIHENAPSRIAKRSERSVMVRAWWSASSLCSKR